VKERCSASPFILDLRHQPPKTVGCFLTRCIKSDKEFSGKHPSGCKYFLGRFQQLFYNSIKIPSLPDLPIRWHRDCFYPAVNVLIAKHVDIEGPGLIEACLRKAKIPYQVLSLEAGSRLPRLDDLTHIVILGGPMNVYEEDRYPFLIEEDLFIKEALQRGKSILGICLGAQLIAKALGAKIFKASVKEIGWYDVSLTRIGSIDPFFSRLPKTFSVFQWHGDTFEIPHGAVLIATSPLVPHQAFRYGENAYGLQFHLEVTQDIIREWMESYEEELEGPHAPLFSKLKILADTKAKIEPYKRMGMTFLKNFFRKPVKGGIT
jgi:GMP synthase-like glutamine amidotransferase